MAHIFFDTEFTGLHKNTTLISIGLVAENGKKFYAELNDYDKNQVDNWIQENVIDNLLNRSEDNDYCTPNWYYWGNKQFVGEKLFKWLQQFDEVEWVSDVCHYDFVLLIDLVYGYAFNMPYGKHCSACHDINQDIAEYYCISEIEAFDKSREDILKESSKEIEGIKHHALYDAKVIKAIYNFMLE